MVFLPRGTSVGQLAARGLSPGLLNAGLGDVPAEQTYLDITQGNRVFDSLYDEELPPLGRDCSNWQAVVERAESAPADIVPGLLASTLRAAGVGVLRGAGTSCAFSSPGPRPAAHAPTFEVRSSSLGDLPPLVRGLRGNDLLIAIERPPPPSNHQLAIGIAGRGFQGNLTSDSTRIDGYVLSTDIAPTVLGRFGVAVPSQMSGQAIRGEGSADPAALVSLDARMASISERRGPVIGYTLLAWLAGLGLAALLGGRRAARRAARLLAVAFVYLPLVLLLAAAFEPGLRLEQLLAFAGAPLLALLTMLVFDGYRPLAVASSLTVLGYAVDMVAGSPLTALSLPGPNPAHGVRFYGIGNELEALLAVLVVAGTGAGLSGFGPRVSPRSGAIAFLSVGIVSAFVFAAGRFGADVGAAIVFPAGAAVAAAALAARRRRTVLLVLATPVAVVALLALVDLVSGANAHLTRSVLDAGGLHDLGDVAQRRLQLSAESFTRPIILAFMPVFLFAAAWLVWRRDLLAAWLRGRAGMRAGLIGGLAATLVGTLANDSGALLLEVGTAYLIAFAGFAWAEAGD
jgi:hypothetical protein